MGVELEEMYKLVQGYESSFSKDVSGRLDYVTQQLEGMSLVQDVEVRG